MNRGLMLGLFHALGASRLIAGTVCDTCCEEAWNLTVGPVGGADPEAVEDSDLIVAWGADLVATNVHFWAKAEAAQRRGVKIVVIDPRKSRTARQADRHLQIRIGTDAALALGVMHILARDGLVDRDYIAAHTAGFDRLEAEVLPRFPPARVAEITGLAEADIEGFAHVYGTAKRSFIRLGEGMTRLARGGEALRAVALLPGVTGAYGRRGGGALLLTAASCELNYGALRRPSGPAETRLVNHSRLGDALLDDDRPAIARAVRRGEQSGRDLSRRRQGASGPLARGSVHGRARPVSVGDRALCRYRAARDDLSRNRGFLPRLRHLLDAVRARSGAAAGRSVVEPAPRAGTGAPHGIDRPGVLACPRQELLAALFDGAGGRVAGTDLDEVRSGRPMRYAAPEGQEFRTPSGRLEFYSEHLAAAGLAPMPDWQPDAQEERDAARWKLRLLTAPGYFQAHTAYSGVEFLRRREGPPYCILHPDEAARRGLADGARVRLFNERGAVGLVLRISDEVLPGVVLVPGQRPDSETLEGTINLLCSDRYTDIGEGATYQSTFLDIAAW